MINDTEYIASSYYTRFSLCSPFTVQYANRSQNNALIIFKINISTAVLEKDVFLTQLYDARYFHKTWSHLHLQKAIFSIYTVNLYYSFT